MPLQDLTPQLRTRLSRMERAVGWFVILATLLLVFGFGYYVYKTAERKGWFLKKITYQTCVSSGAGLKIGDPVKLMGFDVGEITAVIPNDPHDFYNITILFRVKVDEYNYQGYIWSDSKVKVNAGDLLGNRFLEITKGVEGVPSVLQSTNNQLLGILRSDRIIKARLQELELERPGRSRSEALALLNLEAKEHPGAYYTNHFRGHIYFLDPLESPAITERLDKLVRQVEAALPNLLNLTNQLSLVLSNSASLTSNLGDVTAAARPAVSNLALITAQLNQPGALGEWLLPTNLNANLEVLSETLGRSLENLAGITSNLNRQVQANTNLLGAISRTVVDADNLVQGLKRHWLLRSAFKHESTNAPSQTPPPLRSPKHAVARD
jgi:ABC-type transporter Mla subunit MlaD